MKCNFKLIFNLTKYNTLAAQTCNFEIKKSLESQRIKDKLQEIINRYSQLLKKLSYKTYNILFHQGRF